MVVSPGDEDSGHGTKLRLHRDLSWRSPKTPCDQARSKVLQARLNDEGAYLHPRSAVEERTRTGDSYYGYGASEYRGCPTCPVSRNLRSPSALPLRLDTRCTSIDYRYLEIAMEVAEEVARICDSPGPLPTDVPLVFSGINARTVEEFKTWLMVRYNYHGHAHGLMDEAITPEVLALDILGTFAPTSCPRLR